MEDSGRLEDLMEEAMNVHGREGDWCEVPRCKGLGRG